MENVEQVRKGEPIEVRKDPDGTVSVWRMDGPLMTRATPEQAIAAIRERFGQVNPRFIEFLRR